MADKKSFIDEQIKAADELKEAAKKQMKSK